jgi:hypothetical protein
MNKKSILLFISACCSLVNCHAANATLYERAPAHEYVAPPSQSIFQPTYLQRTAAAPPVVALHLHNTVLKRITKWDWEPRTIFSQNTMVYTGRSAQNQVINVLHFWTNGSQEVYQRQYIVHYETLASGFESVTVDRYVASGSSDEYVGQTQYLSSVINNRLYLARVTFTNQYQQRIRELDLAWSKNGVTGTMANPGRNRFAQVQAVNLKATEPLRQSFDLWDSFGLTWG